MADNTRSTLTNKKDNNPEETQEWLDSLDGVIDAEGPERAQFILETLFEYSRRSAVGRVPYSLTTAYVNTIPLHMEEKSPGDHHIEWRIRSLIRWNALAMVVQANKRSPGIGGHLASFASSATLYDVGFNHFFRGANHKCGGDLIYFQGHISPGIYARSFLEGRLLEEDLHDFRHEAGGHERGLGGLSSYPHPWLMPDYWQFPTVSMGLGPIMSIYQARFMKYMQDRNMIDDNNRKVWAFLGDGEMDEPESKGALDIAGREKLDNLIFVVNCNLQRLDGPVRGNGKVIQELEGVFRGAGWNVIKVVWGSQWDGLLAQDHSGLLRQRMQEVVDGEYQSYTAQGPEFARKHFFGKYPELAAMVANWSDDDISRLNRGGHDPHKVYAAYAAAMQHKGQPTVILAKTIKGYGMGASGQGQMSAHQAKDLTIDDLRAFRDHFQIPVSDADLEKTPFYKPDEDSDEANYLQERRKSLGGYLPKREPPRLDLDIPSLDIFETVLSGSDGREVSTTMAFVRILNLLLRDKNIKDRLVPIVPDEARTFGMDGLFRQLGIYSPVGQLYDPQDAGQLMFYREAKTGQIIEEGISEAGAFSSWIAAATSYANTGEVMIPFYVFYSMFGFQRIGDLAWAAGDSRARGFLLGGTAGRTTLNGEGLQHEDGHSHVLASTIPNCISYDPCYACELAVIIQHGLMRMYKNQEDVYFYITLMNENYEQPKLVAGSTEGIVKGMYRFSQKKNAQIELMGSGTILREVQAAASLLQDDFGIAANVWSVTSFTELARDGMATERWNRLHPNQPNKQSYVEQQMRDASGPIVAASDYMRSWAEQIRPYLNKNDQPIRYTVLGTDGYGRSDSRTVLRRFFEVDRFHIVVAALSELAEQGKFDADRLNTVIQQYNIEADSAPPWLT